MRETSRSAARVRVYQPLTRRLQGGCSARPRRLGQGRGGSPVACLRIAIGRCVRTLLPR